ncbi:porin family protein [Olivibacter sp. CPCC 100613]|uniref:porin family protein n=1 Tax=Olivibacter sp. CPCC 100613 TaxID=3079931 RepID=UPI002FFA70D8
MKKNVVTLVAFVMGAFILSTRLLAQDKPLSFGIKAGPNLSNHRLGGNMKGFKSKMNIGGSVGGFVKYDLGANFALQSGIDVHYKISNLEAKTDQSSAKFKSFGVEIPLYGILQGALGSGKAFIGAGPYVGYGITAKYNGTNLFKKNAETGGAALNRFDYGVGGIIGYDFDKNFQINASYQFGLADLHKAQGGSMKSQGAAIGFVYKF